MNNNFVKPIHMVVFAIFVMTLGGFFAVAHVGEASRQTKGFEYGFGSRVAVAPPPDPGLAGDFKKGGEILADKAEDFIDQFLPGSGEKTAPVQTASARPSPRASGGGEETEEDKTDEKDPFEEFYKKNYSNSGSAASTPPGGSWGGFGGSSGGGSWGSSGGSSGGSDDGAPASGLHAGRPENARAKAGGNFTGDAGDTAKPAGNPLFGGPLGRTESGAPQLASLPKNPGSGPGPDQGGAAPQSQPGADVKPHKGGGLSEMPGKKGSADLDGADEKDRGGGNAKFDAKTSGGGSAISAAAGAAGGGAGGAGGGSVPSASAAKEVSPDGKDSKDGKDKDKAKDKDEKKDGEEAAEKPNSFWPKPKVKAYLAAAPAAPEQEFLRVVATEKSNGKDADYLTPEDSAAQPDEAMLKSGSVVPGARQQKDFAAEDAGPAPKPDPETFTKLTPERKKELKKEVHVFLKQVENKYGAMSDIFFTSCAKSREVCEDHKLTEGYLTMHTKDGARLLLAMKYAEKKWQPYIVSFGKTIRLPKPAPAEQPPAVEQQEEEQGGSEYPPGDYEPPPDDGATEMV